MINEGGVDSAHSDRFKRVVDIVLVLGSVWLWLPAACMVALVVRVTLGSPVLFRQVRPGKDCKPFTLYKFRTMLDERSANGALLPDSERLTRFGRMLRSTSLDELPELWNVLRGDMSLVGPRPLLMEYLPLYSARQRRRHEVRPGVTGWAQVNGRNSLGWAQRFEHDLWYVEHMSFALDMKILARTVGQVLKRRGISEAGGSTMSRFEG